MVIAVDTGNRCIKTAHADPFSAGLIRHFDAQPIVSSDIPIATISRQPTDRARRLRAVCATSKGRCVSMSSSQSS